MTEREAKAIELLGRAWAHAGADLPDRLNREIEAFLIGAKWNPPTSEHTGGE